MPGHKRHGPRTSVAAELRAAARRVRDDLVEGLLLGRGRDSDETGRWAAHLGYSSARAHQVVAISFEIPGPPGARDAGARDTEALRSRVRESIEHFVTTRGPEAIVSAREAEVVVVTTDPGVRHSPHPGPRQLGAACVSRLRELLPGTSVIVGIGGTCREPPEIARSYAQAHRTTETMRRLGRNGTVTAFRDLGIHRLLLQAPDLSELRSAQQRRRVGAAERAEVIREQVLILGGAGVDLIILETFGYLDELVEAVTVTSETCDAPIVTQATFADDGHTLGGETPREVASVLSELPIAMLGTNCTIGPHRMLPIVEDLVRYSALPVSAQPNAGQPRRVGLRRFEFSLDGGYFARYLHRFAETGASLVGGCCGTTPAHLAAAGRSLRDLPRSAGGEPRARRRGPGRTAPGHRTNGTPVSSPGGTGPAVPATAPAPATATGTLADQLAVGRFVVAAGIVAPAGGIVDEVLETVTGLQDRGISLFAVAARESARTHLDSLNMASTFSTTPASRPSRRSHVGQGLALSARTSFCIGARIDAGARDRDAEIARALAKVDTGAQFLVSRPVSSRGRCGTWSARWPRPGYRSCCR